MTGKAETASEYPASLVVAMLRAIKRQMISVSSKILDFAEIF